MDFRERFWTWWFDGIPQPVADRLFTRTVNGALQDLADQLVADNKKLKAEKEDLRKQLIDAIPVRWEGCFFPTPTSPEARALLQQMNGDRPLDDGGPVCLPCRNGDHSAHQPTLGDACVGCACEVER